jgi:pyridoxal phosphate enzyme (YggS family)
MSIQSNLLNIQSSIPENVTLVAVSKTKPNSMIEACYESNQRHFGENKVQDLVDKYNTLPKDIKWHYIGHLQTNKVKFIAPFVHLIHAVDSLKLLKEINKQALKNNRIINVLLQFHIAKEASKFGLNKESSLDLLHSEDYSLMKNITIVGIMGMATFTDDNDQIKREFKTLVSYFNDLKATEFSTSESFSELSMGMSGDYKIAIEEGSTMVRVGSSIFGSRQV